MDIKSRRKELNLTLKDVARAVGVSIATVSRWESGDIANMRKDKILALSKILEIEPNFIIDNSYNKNEIKNDLTYYSKKTFEEFLKSIKYDENLDISLVLNKKEDDSSKDIEVIKIPKEAHKKILKILESLKD